MLKIEDVRGAVARGWCHKKNSHKEMDTDLAEAISQEVLKAFKHPGTVGYCLACSHPVCIHACKGITTTGEPQR